jgi:pyrroline-5-carboxylate reductase
MRVLMKVAPNKSGKGKMMTEIAVEATEVPAQLPKVRVAVLGAGKMGGILLQAFLKQNLFERSQIHATVGHAEKAVALSTQWGEAL